MLTQKEFKKAAQALGRSVRDLMKLPFRPGDRVTLSEAGLRQGLQGPKNKRNGVVTGIHFLSLKYIEVRKDGAKSKEWYACEFWENLDKTK